MSNKESIKSYYRLLKKNKKFIFGVLVLSVFLLIGATTFYDSRNKLRYYQAEAIIELSLDGSSDRQKTTIVNLLKSQPAIENAIKDIELSYNISHLTVKITEILESNKLRISATYPSKNLVVQITDSIVEEAVHISKEVLKGLDIKYTQRAFLKDDVQTKALNRNILLVILAGLVIGFAIALFTILATEVFFEKLQTVDDIETELGVPVLATIPRIGKKEKLGWLPWKH